MVELNLSLRSVEASVTQFQASSERQLLAARVSGEESQSSLLNNQQKQIVDEVGISQEAIQKLEEAQILAEQLRQYTDYLNGRDGTATIRIVANDNEPDVEIAGRSTSLSASFTQVSYTEETLDINAKFDDAGNLQELSIDKTTVSAEYTRADLILEDRQFYIAA